MIRRVWAAAATCALACGRSDLAAYSALPGRDAVAATVGADRCYRSRESVLLGPSTAQRNVGHPPGWLRLAGGDSAGAAALVDANGSGLNGQWKRHGPDSVRVTAVDDFLRTELVFVFRGDSLMGRATAHSDADLERDSAGKLRDVRRAWSIAAMRATCDSMPGRGR